MGAVTYPHDDVRQALAEDFVCYKLNLKEPHPDHREASRETRIPWAPTFVFTDAAGREVRRFTGWLPPDEFVTELALTRGLYQVQKGRFAEAFEILSPLGDSPEALYWAGMAAFRDSGEMADLATHWNALRERHPGSTWATRASVIDEWGGAGGA